jgi:hypothetical protein
LRSDKPVRAAAGGRARGPRPEVGQTWTLPNLEQELADGADKITAKIDDDGEITLTHDLSESERELLIAGGLLSYLRDK